MDVPTPLLGLCALLVPTALGVSVTLLLKRFIGGWAYVVGWLFPLIGWEDRMNMVHIYQSMMPPPAFAGMKGLIQKAIPGDWAELVRRIPTLEGK